MDNISENIRVLSELLGNLKDLNFRPLIVKDIYPEQNL